MPRLLIFLFALVCAATAFGQKLDELQGFREFKFGSGIEAVPKGEQIRPDAKWPNLVRVELPATVLVEPALFEQPIQGVSLMFWNNRLYSVGVMVERIASTGPAVDFWKRGSGPESARYKAVLAALTKAFGEPLATRIADAKGVIHSQWESANILMTWNGVRKMEKTGMATSFNFFISDRRIENAMNAEMDAADRTAVIKRKDGL